MYSRALRFIASSSFVLALLAGAGPAAGAAELRPIAAARPSSTRVDASVPTTRDWNWYCGLGSGGLVHDKCVNAVEAACKGTVSKEAVLGYGTKLTCKTSTTV